MGADMNQRIVFDTDNNISLSLPADKVFMELEGKHMRLHEMGTDAGLSWMLRYDTPEEARMAFNTVNGGLADQKPLVHVPKRGFWTNRDEEAL
jgi:hypothetical protein